MISLNVVAVVGAFSLKKIGCQSAVFLRFYELSYFELYLVDLEVQTSWYVSIVGSLLKMQIPSPFLLRV